MDNEKILTAGNAEEGGEQQPAAAEPEKKYTEAEFNAKLDELIPRKLTRNEAKIRKEYKAHEELVDMLKAGTGLGSVEELAEAFKKHYSEQGVEVPKKAEYSSRDVDILARSDAEEIIKGGSDEVADEIARLKRIDASKMTERDKAVYRALTEHQSRSERNGKLASIGVTEDVYNGAEFLSFAGKFSQNTPIEEVYDIFMKMQPQKEIKTPGSMTNKEAGDNGIKDYYTPEEAKRFTQAEINNNPKLVEAIERSMLKW